jgi:hypothetical protein
MLKKNLFLSAFIVSLLYVVSQIWYGMLLQRTTDFDDNRPVVVNVVTNLELDQPIKPQSSLYSQILSTPQPQSSSPIIENHSNQPIIDSTLTKDFVVNLDSFISSKRIGFMLF